MSARDERSGTQPSRLWILYGGWFLLDVDLIVITPLLVPAADEFDVSLGTVTLALTAYLLMFGLMQPIYGNYSDSVGRIRVMRIGLVGAAVANLVAAAAPNVATLVLARGAAGAFAAALLPVTVAYLGDRVPAERRQRAMAGLMTISALGVGAGTIGGGLLADVVSWRLALGVVAVSGLVFAALYARLPETVVASGRSLSLSRLSQAMRGGWFPFLVVFAFVEGGPMVGFYNFFNAALQVEGNAAVVTGLVTSSYGAGAVAGGLLVRSFHDRIPSAAMFGGGLALLLAGYLAAAQSQSITNILTASVLAGMSLSVAQSTLQDWTIGAAPVSVRGTATALVACAVFTGGAVSTLVVSGLAAAGEFRTLFVVAAAVTLPVLVVGTVARARWDRSAALMDGKAD
jgi:predicted MFS family arabinose efflux permease